MTSNVNFDNIPSELQQQNQFCCWRAVLDEKNPVKLNKVPWRVDGLGHLTWSNPLNLIAFEEAKTLYLKGRDLPKQNGQHFGGIGYILNGSSDLVCIDLDHAINESREISPEGKAILDRFKSYTEISPSGKGLHIWVRANIDGSNVPQINLDGQAVEVFTRSHHVTITGKVLPEYGILENRQVEAEALYYKLQAIREKDKAVDSPKKVVSAGQKPRHVASTGAQDQKRATRYVEKALEYEAHAVLTESEGNRNNRLNEAAFSIGRYVGVGLIDDSEVEQTLLSAATSSGLSRTEAETTIQSGLGAGRDNPVYPDLDDNEEYPITGKVTPSCAATEALKDIQIDEEHFTEGGNATRLTRLYGQDLRYCHTWHKWLVWDGISWKIDKDGGAMRYAEKVINYLYQLAAKADSKDDRKTLSKFAFMSDNRSHFGNVLEIAKNRSGIAITAELVDRNPWLLGTQNVVIDLKTGKIHDPQREDLITKIVGCKYVPEATCPHWLTFLDDIFGSDKELISYIQRAIGYTLTGSQQEQVFFFCHGKGQNGKSKFLTVLRALLGDFAYAANFNTFLVQRSDNIRNDLAALAGMRVVTAVEADEGSKLAIQVIKDWTGGEPVTARFLHGEYFSFIPEGKLWLAANNKPKISERTLAAWRRVQLIPFLVTIPEEKRDPVIELKLLKELSGILNWALEGLKEYQKIGLKPPEAVVLATEAYRKENDSLEAFIADSCDVHKLALCKNIELRAAYESFCLMTGFEPISQTKFSTELKERVGITSARSKFGNIWHGIGLKAVDDSDCASSTRNTTLHPSMEAEHSGHLEKVQGMQANVEIFDFPVSREKYPQMPTHPTPIKNNQPLDDDFAGVGFDQAVETSSNQTTSLE